MVATATYDDQLYAAPLNTGTQLLWYRKDLVPNPPKTCAQMIAMATALAKQGNGPQLVFGYGSSGLAIAVAQDKLLKSGSSLQKLGVTSALLYAPGTWLYFYARREQRQRDHATHKARRQNSTDRIDGHHFQGRELLARAHEANLGGQRCTRTTGKQQSSHDRTEFAHQAQRHQQSQGLGGAIALQGVVPLQAQHKTDKQARDRDDRQGSIAEKKHLVEHQARTPKTRAGQDAKPHEQARRLANISQLAAHGKA